MARPEKIGLNPGGKSQPGTMFPDIEKDILHDIAGSFVIEQDAGIPHQPGIVFLYQAVEKFPVPGSQCIYLFCVHRNDKVRIKV